MSEKLLNMQLYEDLGYKYCKDTDTFKISHFQVYYYNINEFWLSFMYVVKDCRYIPLYVELKENIILGCQMHGEIYDVLNLGSFSTHLSIVVYA